MKVFYCGAFDIGWSGRFSGCLINLLILAVILNISCTDRARSNPAGYDLSKPGKLIMPEALLEISGIAMRNGDSSTIYAVQDEEGKVYQYRPADKKTVSSKFAKRGDYEDLAISNNQMIVLRSDGKLFTFPLSALGGEVVESVKEWKELLPKGEYESLFADEDGSVYVLCKDCKKDKDEQTTTGYILRFSAAGDLTRSGHFQINSNEIAQLSGERKIRFRPSGLTRNKWTKQWYILSSVNKQLIVTDENWKIKEVHALNFGPFPQPEGITFDSDRNLYISNEGDEISNGNILKFKFSKP